MRAFRSYLVFFIMLAALIGAPLLHAVVPHTHGDDHNPNHESSAWIDLHQAISLDHKKTLVTFVGISIIVVTALILRPRIISRVYLREISSRAMLSDPGMGELLRRGIHPYRAFG